MNGFFSELRRRKVYRVAAAYVVVAWVLIQVSATVFPIWEMPLWSLRLVIALVLFGFPVALILAWAFDVTPAGINSEAETSGGVSSAPASVRRRGNIVLLGGFGIIVAGAAAFFLLPRAAADKLDKSIAVLPFDNLSQEKENAFFADGIQDDILTNLSKIGDLKVISRTSVMPYRGHTGNVREIGKALGVGAVLEGSVRRDKNRVRVNVQLINTATDQHIWSEIYDRDLTDVFAIQSDLAREIASALQMKLSPGEKARLDRRPTQNGEAYLVYLQAHNMFTHPDRSEPSMRAAEQLYYKAVQLDPAFALAYADLSRLQSWMYHGVDPTPDRIGKAKTAAAEAVRLQPDLPEARLALGYCYYYGDRDYDRALAEFALAQRGLPNDADVYLAVAAIERRQGKWAQSTANFEKATSLNPKDAILWHNLAINYCSLRQYEAAKRAADRGIEAAPDSLSLASYRAHLDVDFKGDLRAFERLARSIPPRAEQSAEVVLGRTMLAYRSGNYPEAARILEETPIEKFKGEEGVTMKPFLLGQIYRSGGDIEKARSSFEAARREFEAALRERPNSPMLHAHFGLANAALGRAEEALRHGTRAMELVPESSDALDGPMYTVAMAQIYASLGMASEALLMIERLLTIPAGITAYSLKFEPAWYPLRQDTRFQALMTKYGVQP